jgi:hypothetical protein
MNNIIQRYLHLKNIGTNDISFNQNIINDFTEEIQLAITLLICFSLIPNKLIAILVMLTIISLFIEYHFFIKHINISNYKRYLYLFVDLIHNCFFLLVVYLFINLKCNYKKLILLNICMFVLVLFFLHFKRCILSIIADDITKIEKNWLDPISKLRYIFGFKKSYITKTEKSYYDDWVNCNTYAYIGIILLNLYCLFIKR